MTLFLLFSNTNSDSLSPKEDDGNYAGCIANISPAERRKRLTFGIIQLVIGLIILIALLITDADKIWRLILFLPFWAAATGYFQSRDKT
jgi:hypothetical protein